ncbi:hypothetical protein OU798_07430 [Prolixibacteraceae bacterium Z1-6]|uniref:Uncharacterized protein n=1 Tax=Draconibacterium aestuarii TaxID=2998507 RepID=A0A9X3F488_9BACT|nr:hypothetical protein [Prolixibacteraceae bacterium Z1-6]
MINEVVKLNSPQMVSAINQPKNQVNIEGRGTGKSFKIGWEMNDIVRQMPRSITAITGRTYGQVYTRTLPSSLKLLAKLGYEKDKDYKITGKPPKGWLSPHEPVTKFDNFISFSNGTGFLMLSQEREGSSRGPNLDREIVDEALTLNKERYDEEVSPANRGNEEYFGKLTSDPVPMHHGFRYVSSMPYSQDQRWLLDFGKYYEQEAGILLFDIWNRVVKMQLQLIEAKLNEDIRLFKEIWNEIVRLKRQIVPFVSKDGLLFTLANAFDNLENLGLSYITREYKKQSLLTFMIEILNWVIDKVEDCYYHLDPQKHIYYDAYNDDYIRGVAEDSNWDAETLETPDSRFDLDCDPGKPLEVVFDWGAKINLMSVGQERNFNFATKIIEPVDCFINEFFNKPDETPRVMIEELVDQFCNYYRYHATRQVDFYRDKYGDHRQPNARNSQSYNAQAIERFDYNGWTVVPKSHRGMEPPQHEKYLLWMNMLKGNDPRFPKPIFNGKNCKFTLISMNNTKLIEKNGKFDKDKSSERSKKILPEEATHFGDAADKRMWTKYSGTLHNYTSTFVNPRL